MHEFNDGFHNLGNIRFNRERCSISIPLMIEPIENKSQDLRLEKESHGKQLQASCHEILTSGYLDWLFDPDEPLENEKISLHSSLLTASFTPQPLESTNQGFKVLDSLKEEVGITQTIQNLLGEVIESTPNLKFAPIPVPQGYASVSDIPDNLLLTIKENFFESCSAPFTRECCLLQFGAARNFRTVQELSNLFSNYGDLQQVIYNQFLGAFMYIYVNPKGVELSEKYLRPLNLLGMTFGLLAAPTENQIASVFFPPKIPARFTKYLTYKPKKRFSAHSDGLPTKLNRIGRCLHITYSGTDKCKKDMRKVVIEAVSQIGKIMRARADNGTGKKNMWFAEFETIQDALEILMKCHNMKVGMGQLRFSFTKNIQ